MNKFPYILKHTKILGSMNAHNPKLSNNTKLTNKCLNYSRIFLKLRGR